MNITRHQPFAEPACPCQEHSWYSTRYRFDIAPGATIEIPCRLCDLCGSITISSRYLKKAIDDIGSTASMLVKKDGRTVGRLCRLKRKVKGAVGRFFERHLLNEAEIVGQRSGVWAQPTINIPS